MSASLSASMPAHNAPPNTLPSLHQLKETLSPSVRGAAVIRENCDLVRRVLNHEDNRLLVVVGPCSIHDYDSVIEYADKLAALKEELDTKLILTMRVYVEKPRTTIGWRGLLNDPHLDGSFDMNEGIVRTRKLLCEIADKGIGAVSEVLDPVAAHYYSDLLCFAAIGARTTESQPHRALVSGLGIPAGFKNGTNGSFQIAFDAMQSASASHSFIGINDEGQGCVVKTPGNPDTVLILRGGRNNETGYVPNYFAVDTKGALEYLRKQGLPERLIVDCSHANSYYDPIKQKDAAYNVAKQRADGNLALKGIMLESHLHTGKQSHKSSLAELQYGVSITDGCLGWEETASLLRSLAGDSAKLPSIERPLRVHSESSTSLWGAD
jgi:3-deoxy-7-phosphoheptulonate synthase